MDITILGSMVALVENSLLPPTLTSPPDAATFPFFDWNIPSDPSQMII